MIPLWLTKVLIFVRSITVLKFLWKLFPNMNDDTPQTIKRKYWIKPTNKVIKKIRKENKIVDLQDGSMYQTESNKKCCDYARWYQFRADSVWGNSGTRKKYKSGWLYVTAADLFASGNDFKKAADNYHFAANQLREVEAFRASMQYYLYSAYCYYLINDPEGRDRSLRRALGGARVSGELELENFITQVLQCTLTDEKYEQFLKNICSWFNKKPYETLKLLPCDHSKLKECASEQACSL